MPISVIQGSGLIGTQELSLRDGAAGPSYATDQGVKQVFINLSGLVQGDEYEFKIYDKATGFTTDLSLPIYRSTFLGPQSPPIYVSPSLILGSGWDITLDKIAGTDRNIFWSIRTIT